MPVLQCDNTKCKNCASVHWLPSICLCYSEKPPVDENGQCVWFAPRRERKVREFHLGDKAIVLLPGDREGKIGKIIAKEPRRATIYRYLVQFPDGEILDYFGDEIEPTTVETVNQRGGEDDGEHPRQVS